MLPGWIIDETERERRERERRDDGDRPRLHIDERGRERAEDHADPQPPGRVVIHIQIA